MLVCLDDINRAAEPARLLRRVVGIASPATTPAAAGTAIDLSHSVSLVMPVWPELFPTLPPDLLGQPWVWSAQVGDLPLADCSAMISGRLPGLTPAEAERYATRLARDPYLVGLFTRMIGANMEPSRLEALADDTIGRFVDTQVRDLCSVAGVELLPHELLAALSRVAGEMLARRSLRPRWSEIEEWFGEGSNAVRCLRLLARHGGVCRVGDDGRLDFRHDRLRDRFLVATAADLLTRPGGPNEVAGDPHFAWLVGGAVARTPLPTPRLAWVRANAPWALFEAVRQIGEPSGRDQERVFEEALAWAAAESRSAPEPVLTAVCWSLVETDSGRVLPIIDAMEPNPLLMAAGLRNGSAVHGMRFFRGRVGRQFEPGTGDGLRDRSIDAARPRHGGRLAAHTRDQLLRPDLPLLDAKAYLALAGHFAFSGLGDAIRAAWDRHRDEVLSYAIWAAGRCPLANAGEVLGPMAECLAAMPATDPSCRTLTDREWMTLYLGWGFRKGMTDDALSWLIRLADRDETARDDVSSMIERVDHPDAIEFVIRRLAAGGGSNLWDHLTAIDDGEPRVTLRSSPTADRARELWTEEEAEEVRVRAFSVWLRATDCKDTGLLRQVERSSPLHRSAVQHRIKLGDPGVADDLLDLLKANDSDGFWWRLAHRVWCEDLRAFASETLGRLSDENSGDFTGGTSNLHFNLADLLVQIPVSDAEGLLRTHWEHLKYSPRMVHAAFRIGTPAAVALAEASLAACPAGVDIFRFAFSTAWSRRNGTNPITLRHLQHLEPHLGRMSREEVLFLAWESERAAGSDEGVAEWIRHHAVPRLTPEDQCRVQVADEMLLAHLDRHVRDTKFGPYLGFLFEERAGQRLGDQRRQLAVLDHWLSDHRTLRGLQVAAECLRHIGSRDDLLLLDRYPIDGDPTEVSRVKLGARFAVCKRTTT